MTILYILLVFMIVAAIVAVEIRDLLSSVIAVGAVGLGLSVAFLFLKAPDVALTQLVVEIVSVIILIRATLRKDIGLKTTGARFLSGLTALVFVAAIVLLAVFVFQDLPTFGAASTREIVASDRYIAEGETETGATNLVASVILDYRAYDTLGEATVLFTAVVGVLAVVRRVGRKSEPDMQGQEE